MLALKEQLLHGQGTTHHTSMMLGSAVGHCIGSSSSSGSIGSSRGSKVRQFMDVDSSPWGASVGLIFLLPTLSSCTSSRNSTNYVVFAC